MARPSSVPDIRITACNDRPVRREGEFVLYWMIAFRRSGWNFSLERAADWAEELGRPLLVFEPLRCDYRWASDRLHRFIIDGMECNARALEGSSATYYPYVEPQKNAGDGLLAALAERACLIVTDDFPSFFLPRMIAAAAGRVPVRMEQVDSNGLLPLRAADRVFPTAYAFRRFLQKVLPEHLAKTPAPDPLSGRRLAKPMAVPASILRRWPAATEALLRDRLGTVLAGLPIDHDVAPAGIHGGASEARRALKRFLSDRLPRYRDERNEPEQEAGSGLSPYLHFGHISPHQVFSELVKQDSREGWSIERLGGKATGKREGWWGVDPDAEAFLDELVTWRELGYNMSWQQDDYDRYESLPDWARKTLADHARDKRKHLFSLEELAAGGTYDPLWNAAQMQLVREGRIHNYLRMLWGKKLLEWTRSPQEAAEVMIELNNKYALDGRNPNSYSGIFWVLGKYDRPWGPERPIFGKVRYMSSENTARKVSVRNYIAKYKP